MKETMPPLQKIYARLFRAWGPQHWWPGDTRLEIMVGAILTQNTAWINVEKAIARLKREKALRLRALAETPVDTLAGWIRPAGYFNQKARRLRGFARWIGDRFGGRLDRMARVETSALRGMLLSVDGIGPETADSILLYAFEKPVFVVDAYTRRFLERHGWLRGGESYDDVAEIFTRALPADPVLFNEFHALIVRLAKEHCKVKPDCHNCPIKLWLPPDGGTAGGLIPGINPFIVSAGAKAREETGFKKSNTKPKRGI